MITLNELNPHNYTTSVEIDENLSTLLARLNEIRSLWDRPMIVTSGLRSAADQERINPSALTSKHLLGAAADVYDPDRELQQWCLDNEDKLKLLWMEDFQHTPTWIHFQCIAPKSGKRWFIP